MCYIYRNEIPQNLTDNMVKGIDEMAKATSQVLETFLCEYCEVNGIKEEELKNKLSIERDPKTAAMAVKEGDNVLLRSTFENVTSGTKCSLNVDFFLYDKERFPKTAAFMQAHNKEKSGRKE